MDLSEAMLVIGVEEGFTESEMQKAYEQLWRNTEILRVFTSSDAASEVNKKLARLNQARSLLDQFLDPHLR